MPTHRLVFSCGPFQGLKGLLRPELQLCHFNICTFQPIIKFSDSSSTTIYLPRSALEDTLCQSWTTFETFRSYHSSTCQKREGRVERMQMLQRQTMRVKIPPRSLMQVSDREMNCSQNKRTIHNWTM